MSYKLYFTDVAKQDLREIGFYILQKSKDKDLTKRFINELRKQCNRILDIPTIGSIPKDYVIKSAGYRFIAYKGYLIFYKVDEINNKIYVVSIFNEKNDYMRVMKKYI